MKIVFLVEAPFTQRDYDRFGVAIIKERGFDVECWDMTAMINPKLWRWRQEEVFRFSGHVEISSMAQVKRLCKDFGNTVAIDMLGSGFVFNRVRKLIKNASAKICTVEFGLLPFMVFQKNTLLSKITFQRVLKKIEWYGPANLLKSFLGPLHDKQRPPVDYRFISGTASLLSAPPYLKGAKEIWIHAFDYDLFLKFRDQERNKDMIVFVDGGISGNHPDFKMFKSKEKPFTTPESYDLGMRKVFDSLEEYFNIPVVIAGHPKIDYKQNKNLFGGRKLYLSKTPELIRDCKLVISNGSTADNFTVLWRKPLLLITTNEIESSEQKTQLDDLATLLNTQTINADSCLDDIDWKTLSQTPIAKYSEYKNLLIKKDSTPDLSIWTIFIDFLEGERKMTGQHNFGNSTS
ncbi:hypothetical protein OAT11_01530 [Nitrospinaceae bacterium]|nr:hypothetical protein [Nitrospinaceae bacterium]